MIRDIVLVSLFAAITAALGLLPKLALASGVPITAQCLGIMLCGTVLGARRGSLSVLLFLLLIAVGLPLLAGGRGGLGLFVSPSAGYLVGFPVAAAVAGMVVTGWRGSSVFLAAFIAALIGGVLILHMFGIVGMALTLDRSLIEASWLAIPFLPGDLIKALLAGMITASLARYRPGSLVSRQPGTTAR